MRIILFFDLPTTNTHDRKIYANFRKKIVKDGFVMMQFSVYSKLVLNGNAADAARSRLLRYKPDNGIVQLLIITERQFAKIECITGKSSSTSLQSVERTIVL